MIKYLPSWSDVLAVRIAVVSGLAWVGWATRVESTLLPGISYEVFLPEERDRALAWAEGRVELSHAPGLKFIETDQPKVFGFELAGRIGADEMHRVTGASASCWKSTRARSESWRGSRVSAFPTCAASMAIMFV